MIRLLAEESYMDLMRSGPHWAFELTLEALTGIVGFLIGRRPWQRWHEKHDREVHGIDRRHGPS